VESAELEKKHTTYTWGDTEEVRRKGRLNAQACSKGGYGHFNGRKQKGLQRDWLDEWKTGERPFRAKRKRKPGSL